jgi:hypothetical protein
MDVHRPFRENVGRLQSKRGPHHGRIIHPGWVVLDKLGAFAANSVMLLENFAYSNENQIERTCGP